jgi:hypothetical protein
VSTLEDEIRDQIMEYFYDMYRNRSGTFRGRERGDIAVSEISKTSKYDGREISRNLGYLAKSGWIEHVIKYEPSRGDPNIKLEKHSYEITRKGIDLKQGGSKYMSDKDKKIKVGKDAVVIGDVSGEIGNGSVVIGPTDDRGNTTLNQPMAVGRGAKASRGSIAIGAGASAGSELFHLIDALRSVPEIKGDEALVSTIEAFKAELRKPTPVLETVNKLWSIIQASATAGGALSLVQQIGKMLGL